MLIIGFRILELAQLQHLLKIANTLELASSLGCALNRFGDTIKFGSQTLDVMRIEYHSLDQFAGCVRKHRNPSIQVRLGAGNYHFLWIVCHRQNLVALGKLVIHHFGDLGDINL